MSEELDKLKREVEREEEREERIIYSSDELLAQEFPDPTFVVDTLIPKDGISIIAGDPNSFKSWVMLHMAKEIAGGKKLWPTKKEEDYFETRQSKTLWVDEEVNAQEVQRRWKKLNPDDDLPINFMAQVGFKIDNRAEREWLLKTAKEMGIELIVFDSLRAIHYGNENNSQDAQYLIDCLHEFTKEGITIISSHHQRKPDKFSSKDLGQMLRGSTALWAGFNSIVSISSERKSKFENEITFHHTKLKEGAKAQIFKVRFLEDTNENITLDWAGGVMEKTMKEDIIKRDIRRFLTEDRTYSYTTELTEAMKERGHAGRSVSRAISDLKDAGHLALLPTEEQEFIRKKDDLHHLTQIYKWKK